MQVLEQPPSAAQSTAEQDVYDVARALSEVVRRGNLPRVQEAFIQAAGLKLDRVSYWLLRQLGEETRMRVSELAHRQGTDVSTVCRQIAKIEQAGLVRREGDPSDLRAVLLMLTEQGREALGKLQATRLELFDRLLAGWPDGERHEFARLFARFTADYLNQTGVH
ncbi:MAG TPA: MarR family transcriptional regulator [Chloroflexota bacterium]|jgi:DNA-binding MarR family transcriptional regulator|nr:MarR family transcriptional regulator [Chloroflexota bacterium]